MHRIPAANTTCDEQAETDTPAAGLTRREALRCAALGGVAAATGAAALPAAAQQAGTAKLAEITEVTAEGVEVVTGKRMVVRFDGKRCIHTRVCVLRQPEVFKANVKGPWIDPDAADAEEVADVSRNCASGAITHTRLDGGPQEAAPRINTVTVREDGPYAFRADLSIDGRPDGFRATLCRCGASANKPYCDSSHKKVKFTATGEPPTQDSQPLAQRGGQLLIEPQKDGPLQVTGNLEITAGSGRTTDRVAGALLCRCGASANKPYCDGSHERIGFKT